VNISMKLRITSKLTSASALMSLKLEARLDKGKYTLSSSNKDYSILNSGMSNPIETFASKYQL